MNEINWEEEKNNMIIKVCENFKIVYNEFHKHKNM